MSFDEITQLLGVPKIESGTGKQRASAVFDTINEWDVTKCKRYVVTRQRQTWVV